VGGGNFLRAALEHSPAPDSPYLSVDRPVTDALGRQRTELTLREIDALAQQWSCWYLDRGVGPRDRVAVHVADSFDDTVHFLALSQIGAIPVLINGNLRDEAVGLIVRTGARGAVVGQERAERLRHLPSLEWIHVLDGVPVSRPETLPESRRYHHVEDDPVLVCHSSGTTGAPKPVIWTHGQSMAGIRWHLARFLEEGDPVILSALPPSHASAIGYTALAMLSGVPYVVQADPRGAAVAEAIEKHAPSAVVGFAVTFADLVRTAQPLERFGSVERWISVGDSSHRAHIATLVQAGRHWERGTAVAGSMFVDGFGSSELGWGGVFSRVTVSGTETHDRYIGQPQPYAQLAVLRPDGSQAAADEVGLLGVKGPTVTPGYWGDHDLSYRSRLAGYWLSGDLVYRDDEGRYFHVDRAVDAIRTSAGVGYSVLMEEALLANLPEIKECAVVAGSVAGSVQAIGVMELHDLAPAPHDILRRANELLLSSGQITLVALAVASTAEGLPVGATGKVLKRLLRERYDSAQGDHVLHLAGLAGTDRT
jgi:acyl-coenzyme A synthetase/AMP-(fatty) acid ligase